MEHVNLLPNQTISLDIIYDEFCYHMVSLYLNSILKVEEMSSLDFIYYYI